MNVKINTERSKKWIREEKKKKNSTEKKNEGR